MDLEGIVSKVAERFEVRPKYRQLGLEFLNDRLGWLARHGVYQTLTEQVVEDELQYFYRMRGAIPIITAEGPKRIRAAGDLYLFRPFEIGVVNKERRYDQELFRLDRRTAERSRKGNGPSRGELIDQLGQTQQLRSYFHRPVSYDDVLPSEVMMRKYVTGQRKVTIRIRELSVSMTPETLDDLWVLNPEFIRLRHDERLFYFWQRVGKGQWDNLVSQTLKQRQVMEYLGEAATYDAIRSNPKAKFIKRGALPSSELVRLGVLTAMPRQKGKDKAAKEAAGEGKTGRGDKPKYAPYAPAHVSLEEFSGYVPLVQLAMTEFEYMLRKEIRQKGAPNIARVMQLAEEVGLIAAQGRSVEVKVRKVISGKEYVIMAKRGTDPKNPDEYVGLKKFLGEKGERVKKFFYSPLERAVQNVHPEYSLRAVHQAASGTMAVLEESGIETRGDLEELLQKGWGAIQAVKGLVNIEPSKRERLTSFVLASQELGYQVPTEAIAATPLKYRGRDSKPIKDAFRGYLEQAVTNVHPDWDKRAVRRAAGRTISTFESNGILFMSQLEELAQRVEQEGESALQAVKGLGSRDPRKKAQVGYVMGALEIAGLYPKRQPAGQAVTAAPSERAATA